MIYETQQKTDRLESPIVSIIVPLYNAESAITRCVDSILKQNFSDFELLLVDDGSLDSSGRICDEYAKKDVRVHVIHEANHLSLQPAVRGSIFTAVFKPES